MPRPSVLYLTHHLPWPACSGGRLREGQLLHRLSADFDIEVVAVSKDPRLDHAHLGDAEAAGVRARIFPASPATAPGLSSHVRRHQSQPARRYLADRLAAAPPTAVHVEGHYLFPLLPQHPHSQTLIVEHNIESQLLEQQAESEGDVALLADAVLTRRTEQACWRSASAVAAVTDDDAAHIRAALAGQPVPVIPGGADHLDYLQAGSPSVAPSDAGRIAFVANFGYPPNLDAAQLILDEILPGVWARCPEATMTFTGMYPPPWLHAAAADPRVAVTGFVPQVTDYLDAADVVLCPLRIGGGVKIKVLEALARGRAVVTTPVGMQGLRQLPEGSVVECLDVPAMIDACVRLLRSPADRELQEKRSLLAVRHLPTWDTSAELLAATWHSLAASPDPTLLTAGS
ncbi:glycosyltransferase [Streptomyces chiangmaiensis]|uniref:D-inositol 3-phosphate glycosyltransferase n=1 Tax=Streptomyces chiangmaiensis TaxID=766497 RepID=A0ABU7FFJ1_9ACTN|nr:glycosyltransferase [Streptomyces chiangmaiensis]MED7822838.1 glycosyltransferase [Streptomyces chiangmaiensis]